MAEYHCPDVPHRCEFAQAYINDALDGLPFMDRIAAARKALAQCPACLHMLEFQLEFKVAMSHSCREEAPAHLQLKITQALQRIELSDLTIEDL